MIRISISGFDFAKCVRIADSVTNSRGGAHPPVLFSPRLVSADFCEFARLAVSRDARKKHKGTADSILRGVA